MSCRLQEAEEALSASQHSLDAERERCYSIEAELQLARKAKEEVRVCVQTLHAWAGEVMLSCLFGRWMRRLCC
jgi:hypothetical protein